MLCSFIVSASQVPHSVSLAVPTGDDSKPSPALSFPFLDLKEMSKEERQHLVQQLYSESVDMMDKFQNLFSATTKSLKQRNIEVKEILCQLVGLGPLLPTYDDLNLPVFRRQLPALRKSKSVDDAMLVIGEYCSFFNFRMIEHIIDKLGTPEDKKNLSKYEEQFNKYAQRHVFECPSELGVICDDHIDMFVKLDNTYNNCTIENLHLFVNKLWSIFNVSSAAGLKLCRFEPAWLLESDISASLPHCKRYLSSVLWTRS